MFRFRKKKITPKEFALDIYDAFVQIMKHEVDETKKFDREAFKAEHGWDYDKKRFTDESSFLFTFFIYNEVENHFPKKKNEILKELTEILKIKDMEFLLAPLKDYSIAWYDALARELEIQDESILNNPIYCVSKLASIRCFGEEWADPAKIMMFSVRVNFFTEMLSENFKRYEVV